MSKSETTAVFAERLTDLINDFDISYRDLEKCTGISASAISKYTNEGAQAPITAVAKLAKYFGVSADYLLGLSKSKITADYLLDLTESGMEKNNDKYLQFVSDFTGLNYDSISHLRFLKGIYKKDNFYFKLMNLTINTSLQDIYLLAKKYNQHLCKIIEKSDFFVDYIENLIKQIDFSKKMQDEHNTQVECYGIRNFISPKDENFIDEYWEKIQNEYDLLDFEIFKMQNSLRIVIDLLFGDKWSEALLKKEKAFSEYKKTFAKDCVEMQIYYAEGDTNADNNEA